MSTTVRQGNFMFLRVAITLQSLAVFVASITAGLLLSSPSGGVLHTVSAYGVLTMSLLHLVAAVLAWRIAGVPPRPTVLYAVGFFGATLAQLALGLAHVTTLHVPLGVLMFGGSVFQLGRALTGRAYVAAAA